ncbi:MAG: hypothetical protein HQ561_05520 [Desulfobacteraceae bacterium]|nr:hypothetical protein [Desulfobacteraceae bacterium]
MKNRKALNPLSFGDDEAMIKAIHLIGRREGPGTLWGQGVRRMAEKVLPKDWIPCRTGSLRNP